MSELEKIVEQKLAEARKCSESKKIGEKVDSKNTSEVERKDSKNSKDNQTSTKDSNGTDKKKDTTNEKKLSDSSRKPGNSSKDNQISNTNSNGTDKKKNSSTEKAQSDSCKNSGNTSDKGRSSAQDSVKSNDKTSSVSKPSQSSTDANKNSSGKPASNKNSTSTKNDSNSTTKHASNSSSNSANKSSTTNTNDKKAPLSKNNEANKNQKTSSGTSNKNNVSSKVPTNKDNSNKNANSKTNANSSANKTSSKTSNSKDSGKTSSCKDSKSDEAKKSLKKNLANDESKNNSKDVTNDKKCPEKSTKITDTEEAGHKDQAKNRSRSTSKTKRDRSKSPRNRSNIERYGSSASRYSRHRPSARSGRSPPRRRSPSRGRSRSPLGYRDSRRWSPRRHSRSPTRRSRSRSRYNRSRSPDKALMAKKSFLDDLAVRFALEGKEFPELEQYRCATNSQFVSYPIESYSQIAQEHGSRTFGRPMYPTNVGAQMGESPMMYANPFNPNPYDYSSDAFPEPIIDVPPVANMGIPALMDLRPVIEVPPLISYPISGMPSLLDSPSFSEVGGNPQEIINSTKDSSKNKVLVDDSSFSQFLGSQPPEKYTRAKVKRCVIQAVELLDNLGSEISSTTKFMYRTPTFYENNVNENRSPVVQTPTNPRFAFSSHTGETSDPFGNIPRKLKPIIELLRLDEGRISNKIFQRQQKLLQATNRHREKLEFEERQQRLLPKVTLQKNTQTDPTVCTECLLRMVKVKVNGQTQTATVPTVDSVAQTNPMPAQTQSEFGSITELTPNQVRAVSELIKYIKLTATSGSLIEMRDSMQNDQVYNLNGDLRTAYTFFNAMVEHKNPIEQPQEILEELDPVIDHETDDFEDVVHYDDNHGPIDEYEEYHRNFCGGDQDTDMFEEQNQDNFTREIYDDIQDDLGPVFERRMQARRSFDFDNNLMNTGSAISDQPFGSGDGRFMEPGRSNFKQRGRGGMLKTRGFAHINRMN
ncbi:protein SON-like isoform X2 [Topomyia yanbarensis]|uniref:protein SON-like isoform X2 n=1 Tax=Topomyia yanbarensis TaxID=2498891 RepID=UPI00273CC7CB|nr:protein SON-like isoform X2 [Topomyia yanbarensis]